MPNERTIASDAPKSVCTFTILSEGNEVSKTYHVLSIIVNKEINRIPSAIIIMMDGEPAKESFDISNKTDFEPGKKLEIKAGYRTEEETIFKGLVIKHGIKVRKNSSVLMIECRDEAVKMTVSCKSKYFKDVKDSDVIEELIDAHGIEKDVETTQISHKELVQYNTTDWDMMLCRVDANGLLCIANDGKLEIARPDFASAPVLTVQYGATVHDLDAEIDARLQFKAVKAAAWNSTDQEMISNVEAEDPGVPDTGNITTDTLADVAGEESFMLQHSGKLSEQELQQWANAKMLKHKLAKIRGRVTTDGTAAVKPGTMFQLNGVGERFEGKLFVTGVRHQIDKGNWQTTLQFGVNPEWFVQTYPVQQPLAGALLPAIQGLQIGVVTKLEGDPDGEDRIMVRLPHINTEDEGIWSRISTLDAGSERGTFFRPEIGDEVIVGFINNDPRFAVILGMCNSSAKAAPIVASDDNHEKGYVSRSGMKVIFNDDKKTINIETPAGNKVLLSEEDKAIKMEDQHGNKLSMDQDGVKIESIKDIVLKAATDIKAEGVNINVKGSGGAKIEGSSTAEISSGGSTTVKGSMVQIN
ncbi:type VI secretion system tip protein VgrG [Paradesertivirga mongoliensis]|uniref:Type VI secretion system tip protein VgrG n=1 Tax=Paradesertivirga mongoliensis TaxID=2100740 RepID=A0ABW4ZMN4_9SPHI|nr:type VI secretion system tip protein VgrG [Pedobacter mongoliensis]